MPTQGHHVNIVRYDDQYVVTIDGRRRHVCGDIRGVVELVDAVLHGAEPPGSAAPMSNGQQSKDGHIKDGHG